MARPTKVSIAPYPESWREELLATLAARIREIRTLSGIPLTDFADILDIDLGQISRIEHGKTNIKMVMMERIAAGLGVEAWEFLVPIEKSDVLRPSGRRRRRRAKIANDAPERPLQAVVGARIRELRELQGLSLVVLADLIDTNGRQLSYVEQGRMNSTIIMIDRIARGLRVDLYELFVPVEKSDVLGPSTPTRGSRKRPRSADGGGHDAS